MNHKEILIIIPFILLGIILFGSGITGMVVSESCCFPPNCPEEQVCNFEDNSFDSVRAMAATGFAIVSFLTGYIFWNKNN